MSELSPDNLLKPSVELPSGDRVVLHRKVDNHYGLDIQRDVDLATVRKLAKAVSENGGVVAVHSFPQRLIVVGETAGVRTLLDSFIGNGILPGPMQLARDKIRSIEEPQSTPERSNLQQQLVLARNKAEVTKRDLQMGLPAQRAIRQQQARMGLHS